VETRRPWGGPPGNLLVDGDFEHSLSFEQRTQQTGWLAFDAAGPVPMRGETGGLCKSGLQCALVPPEQLFVARGVAADGVSMVASLWARPPAGSGCAAVRAYLVGCTFTGAGSDLLAERAEPDESGWCLYRTTVRARSDGACLVVDNTATAGEALIDAATVFPTDGSAPLQRRARRDPPGVRMMDPPQRCDAAGY
jgi:hypothetical protein